MAYTAQPAQPRQRPGVVTAATVLIALVAVMTVFAVVLQLMIAPDVRVAYEEIFDGEANADTMVNGAMIGTYAGAGLSLLVAVAFGVLAWLDARGKQPARIVTWVLSGLYLCCSTGALAIGAMGSIATSGTGSVDQKEMERILSDAVPGWINVTSTGISVICLLAALAAVILLALPAANEYFRRPVQEWEPPVPFSGIG